jgi:hypothetical protein
MTGDRAALPPRVGVAFPAAYTMLDLRDPDLSWARGAGIQAAAQTRRGSGTPDDPLSLITLSLAVVPNWVSTSEGPESHVDKPSSRSTMETGPPSTVDAGRPRPSGLIGQIPAADPAPPAPAVPPVGTDDWPEPPAYLYANGMVAIQLTVARRIPTPAGPIQSYSTEILVPLPETTHVVIITAATTDPARRAEAAWTAQAVAGTITYRPTPTAKPEPAEPPPLPELRFATLFTPAPVRPSRRGTIGQAALDQLTALATTPRPGA